MTRAEPSISLHENLFGGSLGEVARISANTNSLIPSMKTVKRESFGSLFNFMIKLMLINYLLHAKDPIK